MKKIISVLFFLVFSVSILSSCGRDTSRQDNINTDSDKLTVVATLFPQYDFAREIAGDKADIILLLPPGMESHSFEPTPGDIITIHNSDIFLYTGDEMEPWVSGIVDNMEELNEEAVPVIADLSKGIELHMDEHTHLHEEEPCTDQTHEHEDGYVHSDADHEEHDISSCTDETHNHTEESSIHEALIIGEHNHSYNPHIWTSPVLAMTMVENIIDAFVEADPVNASYYEANGHAYLSKLHELDHHFRDIVEHADFDTVYVGSKFSLLYFMEEYGLHYVAAYDSCEEEAEPSIKRVVSMIKSMKEAGITAVYYQELVEPYIADTIAEAAGGETYLFHSCHNVSRDDFESGVTYLSLMEQNALNLEKGLNR
ncbi:MAG: zinc ABC transporter substrate-binding protein [Lachnospiraceae bacterium]|nr:zinc ABC transporter substrate-binding protein [Lachnospiraceae bacterium]